MHSVVEGRAWKVSYKQRTYHSIPRQSKQMMNWEVEEMRRGVLSHNTIMVLQGKMMREERGTTEMIKKVCT
jgi:hypothetical protein